MVTPASRSTSGALLVLIQLVGADAVFVVTDPAGQGAAHIGHFNMLFFVNLLIATVGVGISAMFAVRRLVILRGEDTVHA